jgi:hypothetical protein
MDRKTLAAILQARAGGQAVVVATRLDTAETRLVTIPAATTDALSVAP